jgi:L-alanine-DL-glutamate epimerase-like enolase superfamily enzyme
MSLPTDIRICAARGTTERLAYRTPIKFGGRVVTDAVMFHVELDVETRTGKRATGYGSMPLGNAWAWPSATVGGDETLTAMRSLGERLLPKTVNSAGEFAHPLELTRAWEPLWKSLAGDIAVELKLPETMPPLAALVAVSPLEAAIHDAFGRVHESKSYNLLGAEFITSDLSHFLNEDFRGEYLDRYTLRTPKPQMPLYHWVGALDPLTNSDVAVPVGDGLPETLGEWILADGLTHLKIKLAGNDLAWDVARVLSIEKVAVEVQTKRNVRQWSYSCDFNEKCPNVEYVLDFLANIREFSPLAFERIHYIEQPTHRNLKAEIKPVVIDESLIDFESLLLAREMGYSGVALKACKGQTEALLMGAAAQKFGLFLCVQDLTCPGFSFLHSASLAARIPTVAAIEGNSRQYCPVGNRGWDERYPGMFKIREGVVRTAELDEIGLGFSVPG